MSPRPRSGHAFRGLTIGLMGGSFNPAHDGHRHVALWALRSLRLDFAWWLVSPGNPLKPSADMAPLADRLEGARVAAAGHPRVVVTAIEGELGTRYTADTLAALRRRFPRTRFVWLMGADNLAQIPRWRDWEAIFATTPIAVFGRPRYSMRALGGQAARRFARRRVRARRAGALARLETPAWVFIPCPLHPASSTAIRQGAARLR